MINLPEDYLKRMRKLLGEEYPEFFDSYNKEAVRGIRFNRKKARPETVEMLKTKWKLEPVKWCPTGFSYAGVRPGLSVYHDAGVFYIQEPSAMSVAEAAGIRENDLVLDLCAAPGGKSTAAAERCRFLLANEIIPSRAKTLSSNIERLGFTNTIVCSAEPSALSDCLEGIFDVVLCDAPCSGEGMMRRDEIAVTEWSPQNVETCIGRQKMILQNAAKMLRCGGKLVYSTCTFEPGENEGQIDDFLEENKTFTLISQNRIWPHRETGEGHFCAVMKKGEGPEQKDPFSSGKDVTLKYIEKILKTNRIHILRSGLSGGEYFTDKKGIRVYEPSHADIMSTVFTECENGVDLSDETDALKYLGGDVLRLTEQNAVIKGNEGFCGVYFDGYPLGVGKRCGSVVKNHLPKGLRRFG